jgi:hypothetical protein
MKKMKIILVTTAILLVATFSYGRTVNDTGSPNFWPWSSSAIYDYRDMGSWGTTPLGTEGISGAYFQVSTAIQPGGYLTDFNNVISITATHSSGRTYPLIPSTCRDWQLPNHWPWSIFLRPEGWMFSGTWSFTLVYTGSDKKEHIQICDGTVVSNTKYPIEAAPIGAIPPAVSHVQMIKNENGDFLVSWSGIGDNPGNVDYKIEIYDENDVCVETVYRMIWRIPSPPGTCPTGQVCNGWYDPALNRVFFTIPGSYLYRLVRIRQEIMAPNKGWPRALKQTRLPAE